jgi:hypothetical protein
VVGRHASSTLERVAEAAIVGDGGRQRWD